VKLAKLGSADTCEPVKENAENHKIFAFIFQSGTCCARKCSVFCLSASTLQKLFSDLE
jgi:hypothetical protein